jgi:excisionase family DNA binding protein
MLADDAGQGGDDNVGRGAGAGMAGWAPSLGSAGRPRDHHAARNGCSGEGPASRTWHRWLTRGHHGGGVPHDGPVRRSSPMVSGTLTTSEDHVDQLMTIKEAAQTLAVTEAAIRKWLYQRRLRAVKVGRLTRLRREDVEAVAGGLPERRTGS